MVSAENVSGFLSYVTAATLPAVWEAACRTLERHGHPTASFAPENEARLAFLNSSFRARCFLRKTLLVFTKQHFCLRLDKLAMIATTLQPPFSMLFVQAPVGNGYTTSSAMQRINEHLTALGGASFVTDPESKLPIPAANGTWEVRIHDPNLMDRVRLILTRHYGLEIRESRTSFGLYQATGGVLDHHEFSRVIDYSYSQADYQQAFDALISVGTVPSNSDITTAAKLIGALGSRVPREIGSSNPHPFWLFTEAYHLQGKF